MLLSFCYRKGIEQVCLRILGGGSFLFEKFTLTFTFTFFISTEMLEPTILLRDTSKPYILLQTKLSFKYYYIFPNYET